MSEGENEMPIEKRPLLSARQGAVARGSTSARGGAATAAADVTPSGHGSFAGAPAAAARKFDSFTNGALLSNNSVERRNWGSGGGAAGGGFVKSRERATPGRRNANFFIGQRDQNAKGGCDRGELGSLSRPGPRKGNVEVIKSREFVDRGGGYRCFPRGNFAPRRRYISTFNKERFLQANCQFVVVDVEDYSVHKADPDLPVEWDNIEEVRIYGEEGHFCPICLYPPVAAKITRCGHVYCHPCILHYLALSDHEWRKCPICNEAVYAKTLKSIKTTTVKKVSVGSELTMRLMCCNGGSTIALPKTDWPLDGSDPEIERISGCDGKYAKLLLASVDEVRRLIINRERHELDQKWAVDKDEPEVCFIVQALDDVDRRDEALVHRRTTAVSNNVGNNSQVQQMQSKQLVTAEAKIRYMDAFDDLVLDNNVDVAVSDQCSVSPTSPPIQHSPSGKQQQPVPVTRFFYQASDGQQIYLHSLNARCLVHEYGSLAAAPETVTGRVLALERITMDDEMRSRYRYLSHIPLSTTFILAELRFADNVLSKCTFKEFADEIAQRKRARQRKTKEDKRLQHKAEQLDRAILLDPTNYAAHVETVASGATPEIPILHHVRSAQHEIDALTTATNANQLSPSAGVESEEGGGGLSFAQMLRSKPKVVAPPVVRQKTEASFASASQMVSSVDDGEESMPAPQFNNTLGDALLVALRDKGNKKKKQKRNKNVAQNSADH